MSSEAAVRQSGLHAVADDELRIVTISEFIAVDEPGADPLLGDEDGALIPENGDVMFYGDGGAGKTTLSVDLACHLAAGDDWLGIRVARAASVLLIENEGPRQLFRPKLRRKLEAWKGSAIDDRILLLEQPWGRFTFADETWRQRIAAEVNARGVDVLIVGPITRSGMNEAGTLQEVRDFMGLVEELRRQSDRRLTVVLIHHENKGGQVSGAWEGAGDTLFHVQGQGHGRTRLYIQKARWASSQHATSLELVWAEGESFVVEEKAEELDDASIAERVAAHIGENPGTGWGKVEQSVSGARGTTIRRVRDQMLADGHLVSVVNGEVRSTLQERTPAGLHLAGDPTIRHLLDGRDTAGTQAESLMAAKAAAKAAAESASCVLPLKGHRDVDAAAEPPPLRGDDRLPLFLADAVKNGHVTHAEADEQLAAHGRVERAAALAIGKFIQAKAAGP